MRDSEMHPCPEGETCSELSILRLGSILETLDLVIVTPHTVRPTSQKDIKIDSNFLSYTHIYKD